MSQKTYLGDGAYASFDGYSIWITTEDGISTTNRICLEPEVYAALEQFVSALKAEALARYAASVMQDKSKWPFVHDDDACKVHPCAACRDRDIAKAESLGERDD